VELQFKFNAKEAVAATLMELEPLVDAEAVSVAVSVCAPLVSIVAENWAVPPASVEFAGSMACASLLVKCTVPE
jgi:hypothetical protein